MGLDRFANFISKFINNEGIEELDINHNIRKIVANHVIFDLNFLIYQEIVEIEKEINDIVKIILCLPFSFLPNTRNVLEDCLRKIFNQNHWKLYNLESSIETIFDGFTEDEIITKFLLYISTKISSIDSDLTHDGLSIIEYIIYEKIINVIINYIEKIHEVPLIQTISIFVDGIPSVSKIIEQRRRRLKNHLESVHKKKIFAEIFDEMEPHNYKLFDSINKDYIDLTVVDSDLIVFDYFKWIKYRFSIDKSLGPSSLFMIKLEQYLQLKLSKHFSNIKIHINSSQENGESDFKIFKYISSNNLQGEYCIHTSDSDFIHQIIVQQTYFKILNRDSNLSIIKYLKNNNVQIIEAPILIKNILDQYNTINNTKNNNYKIIWDICLLFLFFGNDHLPSSIEVGPELGLDFFLKCHHNALDKNNIISIKKSNISFDFNNFSLVLKEINKTKIYNITKIMLQRFFKINNNLITLFVDKLQLDYKGLLVFLKKFITWRGLLLDSNAHNNLLDGDAHNNLLDGDAHNNLLDGDARKIYSSEVKEEDKSKYIDLSIFDLNEHKKKLLLNSVDLIEENLDYYEYEFSGLILYVKPHIITNDSYQDLYNLVLDKASSCLMKTNPEYYDYIDIHTFLSLVEKLDNNCESTNNDYLKKMYHLIIIQFGNMSNFHSDNITYYKYNYMPSLSNLINYIDSNLNNTWLSDINNKINNDNIIQSEYLNSTSHQLLISPFINIYNNMNNLSNMVHLINMTQDIDNVLLKDDHLFEYRDIDIKKFLLRIKN